MDEPGRPLAIRLPRGVPREHLQRAYRTAAKRLHPDVGGDAVLFRALQADFAAALADLDRPQSPAHGHYRTMAVATEPRAISPDRRSRPGRPAPTSRSFSQVLATQLARHGMAWA